MNLIDIYIQGFTKLLMKLSVTLSDVGPTSFGNSGTEGPTLILDTLRHRSLLLRLVRLRHRWRQCYLSRYCHFDTVLLGTRMVQMPKMTDIQV